MLQDAATSDKKSSLRLYDSLHLNDPDEGNYFFSNFDLPEKYKWIGERDMSHAYIASFIIPNSEKDMNDNLVFWREYGDEGEGCSLSLPIPRSRLQKVLYGTEGLERTCEELGSVLNFLDPLLEIDNSSIQEILAATVWESLERIRYLHKDEAYKYEKECRFVVAESNIDKDKVHFEDQDPQKSPAHVRHYYELEELRIQSLLSTGSIITLGPCVSHPDNVEYYLKILLQRAYLGGQKFKTSRIPYRKP